MIVYLSKIGRNLKLLLFYLLLLLSLLPIYVATEHKSHSNLKTRTYKPEDNLNMNKTSEIYKIQHLYYTALTADPNLNARPRPTRDNYISLSCGHLSIGRCESRTRYLRDGKLIIGAAKLIDLDNYIKILRGYFTKNIHPSTLFLFNTNISVRKQMHV